MNSLKLPYLATAALSGALFGAGMYVSQMVDAQKVLRFLDITAMASGGWDPSLAFVIVPAILIMFAAVQFSRYSIRPSTNPNTTASTGGWSRAPRCLALAGAWRASARDRPFR